MTNKEKIALAKNLDEEIDLLTKKHRAVCNYPNSLEFRIQTESTDAVVSSSVKDWKAPWYFNESELEKLHILMEETKTKYLKVIEGAVGRKEKELSEMFK